MGEEQWLFRVAGWMLWILMVALMLWSDYGNGQAQGKVMNIIKNNVVSIFSRFQFQVINLFSS